MHRKLNLLFLEDCPDDAELIQAILRRSGIIFEATVAANEKEFLAALENNNFHAVLADNALPQYNSMEALKLLRSTNPHVAFILVTGTVSEEFAVNIIKQGADDYILKTNLTRLPTAMLSVIEKKKTERERETEKELSLSIINSLPGIFFLCDKNGKFLRWNKNLETISGYTALEIAHMTLEYFFTGNKKDHIQKFVQKNLDDGHAETEATFVTRENRHIPYYFTCRAVSFEGKKSLICVGLDISASKQTEKELKELNSDLHRISAHLEDIREKEQTRIAREVHDQIGQQLTAMNMDLKWIKGHLDEKQPVGIRKRLEEMSDTLDETVMTVRRVASDLRPSILDDFGLAEVLDWQGKEFAKRSGVSVTFRQSHTEFDVDPSISTGLFRIYQEVLTNIARHAEATNIKITLELSSDELSLTITDDGIGFDSSKPIKSLGLLGMKERAYMIGGKLNITSEPGKGTTVVITIPVKKSTS